jgi:hypothetical protein
MPWTMVNVSKRMASHPFTIVHHLLLRGMVTVDERMVETL